MKPQILVPFDPREALSIADAAVIAGTTARTMRRWAYLYDLGRIIGGQWRVSRIALGLYLDGEPATLRSFLAGERRPDVVTRYMPLVDNAEKDRSEKTSRTDRTSRPCPTSPGGAAS